MEIDQEPTFFATPAELREWLQLNYDKKEVLWLGYYKKASGLQSITWPESVDQALCFGWIDGLRKSIDDISYKIRFTPRRKTSIWSNVNLKRVPELIEMGLMTEKGLMVYELRNTDKSRRYAYERDAYQLSENFIQRLSKEALAMQFFEQLAPGYKKSTVAWVMSAKREDTREKRFQILLQSCEEGKRIPMLR